jgi:HEAT repeat protein
MRLKRAYTREMRPIRGISLLLSLVIAALPAGAQLKTGVATDAAAGGTGSSAGSALNSGSGPSIAPIGGAVLALPLSNAPFSPSVPVPISNSIPAASERAAAPAILAPAASQPDVRPFGVELEYALTGTPQDTKQIPEEAYTGPLDAAAARFGLPGKPVVGEDLKYQAGHKMAEIPNYDGSESSRWKTVPEETEGRLYDGVELVTPPLKGEADERALIATHRYLMGSGHYRRGYSSSAHFTFDVSDLISKDGDASRLVDAILFIEMSWPKLFAAASPLRYGTIVNRFSVPLAVDQPELLNELAALPRAQRSYENVRSIFQRHHTAEIALSGSIVNAWKMRAANYGKLFGLQSGYEEKRIPVIEFRVADLPEGEELARQRRLFDAVLSRAPQIDRFESPFKSGRVFAALNSEIAAQDRGAYKDFLGTVGLEPEQYPFLGRLGESLTGGGDIALLALRAAAASAFPGGLPPNSSAAMSALDLIDSLLESDDPVVRRFAAAALISRPDAEVMPRAAELIRSDDESLHLSAVDALWGRQVDGVWPVLTWAATEGSSTARYWAYVALHGRDDARAAVLLRRGLSDPDQRIRELAWDALANSRTPESARVLEEMIGEEYPDEIRDAAWSMLRARNDSFAREIVRRRAGRGGAAMTKAPPRSLYRRFVNWYIGR